MVEASRRQAWRPVTPSGELEAARSTRILTAPHELVRDGRADLGVGQRELDGRRLVSAALEPLSAVTGPIGLPVGQVLEDDLVTVLAGVLCFNLPFDIAEGPAHAHTDLTELRERETGVHLHGELGHLERHLRVYHSVQLELLLEVEGGSEVRRELIAHIASVCLSLLPFPAGGQRG